MILKDLTLRHLHLLHKCDHLTTNQPAVCIVNLLFLIILGNFRNGRLREKEPFTPKFPVLYFIFSMFEIMNLLFNDLSYRLFPHFTQENTFNGVIVLECMFLNKHKLFIS